MDEIFSFRIFLTTKQMYSIYLGTETGRDKENH